MRPQKSNLEGGYGFCLFGNPVKILVIWLLGTCWATIIQSCDSKLQTLCVCVCLILTSTNHKASLRHELVWVHNHLISRDWPSFRRTSKQNSFKSKGAMHNHNFNQEVSMANSLMLTDHTHPCLSLVKAACWSKSFCICGRSQ